MKFEDLVAFAKAGYTPAQVKELLEYEVEEEQQEPESKEPEPNQEIQPDEGEPESESESQTDVSLEINKLKKELEETKAALKDAQADNVAKDASNVKTETDEDIVNDLFRSFM